MVCRLYYRKKRVYTIETKMAHAFISYVRENQHLIDKLVRDLRNYNVEIWLDRGDLSPGVRWKSAIRTAIQSGNFFLACFSSEYYSRQRRHMNEELAIAIDEIRNPRRPDTSCFIPVLLDEVEIPAWFISNAEFLTDIQAVKLYEGWDAGILTLVRALTGDAPERARVWKLLKTLNEEPLAPDRLHAIRQLGAAGPEAYPALKALVKTATDDDPEIRKASFDALASIGRITPEVLGVLVAALCDESSDVPESIAKALGHVTEADVPHLVAAIVAVFVTQALGIMLPISWPE